VVLRRDGSQVTDLQVTVGGRLEKADTDLGDVPPADAARYLLSVAPQLSGRAGDQAVMGGEIAEGIVVWPRLLRIARDDNASESSRKAAAFWVSQEASVTATAGLDSLASDDAATVSIRSDALFYLARRPNAEGIPALIRVAETSKSAKLRKDAIWYLGQSQDSRALALFEKILSGR
jgi:HEAT repeat protein